MPSSNRLNHDQTLITLRSLTLFAIAFFLNWDSQALCDEPIPKIRDQEQAVTPFLPTPWEPLPTLPDWEGFAGAFIGTVDDYLVVAGGANFPDRKPWEGGTKVWYDDLWALKDPNATWQKVGKLPRPLGYGVALSTSQGSMICIGGSDALQHYSDVFSIHHNNNGWTIQSLPPLPHPIANACGVRIGDALYVVGGQEHPAKAMASSKVYRIPLLPSPGNWEEIGDLPGPGRILATAANYRDHLVIMGGAELLKDAEGKTQRRYLKDAHVLQTNGAWLRIADLPFPSVAAPSPSMSIDIGDFTGPCLLGGDDGTQLEIGPSEHQGFRRELLCFDLPEGSEWDQGVWKTVETLPVARVTTGLVRWRGNWVLATGESRPGVRSPQVWWRKGTP